MDCAAAGPSVVVRWSAMTAGERYVVAGAALAVGLVIGWTLMATRTLDRASPFAQPIAATTGGGPAGGSILWVMSVGVSRYANSELNLEFANADAIAMADALRDAAKRGPYREVRTLVLTDEQVTRQSIIEGLSRFLGQAGPDDVALLFVAGHGVRDLASGSYYFLPNPATADNLLGDGLRMSDFDEMLRIVRRNVRSVIVMLDTCHAG
ncbi:MAG: caspase family protein, partial [bacterium]